MKTHLCRLLYLPCTISPFDHMYKKKLVLVLARKKIGNQLLIQKKKKKPSLLLHILKTFREEPIFFLSGRNWKTNKEHFMTGTKTLYNTTKDLQNWA